MPRQKRIYLDNAATSWPKPNAVYDATDHFQRHVGTSAGRSGYDDAMAASQLVGSARQSLARLLDINEPQRVVFTLNGTDSLNQAIHGILQPGDHVVTTAIEHNSVVRPLTRLQRDQQVTVTYVPVGDNHQIRPQEVVNALTERTKMVIVTHASNVTGAIQPVAEIGQLLRDHSALFLVDAAQTVGHVPVSVSTIGADLVAASGHKGLLGPLGTGVLYVGPAAESILQPTRQGGTGSASHDLTQPWELPDRLESGSLNLPGIAGIGAASSYLLETGIHTIHQHLRDLWQPLVDSLKSMPGVTIYTTKSAAENVGIVSFQLADYHADEVASLLDVQFRIQVRFGLHCAPGAHHALGTARTGGTVRASLGPFNTLEDVKALISAVTQLVAGG